MNSGGDSTMGDRIRRRRRALGLSATELARLAGVSLSYISQLEHGHQQSPSMAVARRLAATLSWATSELLSPDTPPSQPENVPIELSRLALQLSLSPEVVTLLCSISIENHHPTSGDDWLFLYLSICQACHAGNIAVPLAASTPLRGKPHMQTPAAVDGAASAISSKRRRGRPPKPRNQQL